MALKFRILTRPNTRKLEPGQTLQEYGITFERLANGDGKWSVNLRIEGQPVHRHLGRKPLGLPENSVSLFIEKACTEVRQNLPKGRKVAPSFHMAASKYLEKLEEEGGKTIARKRINLDKHMIPFLQIRPSARSAPSMWSATRKTASKVNPYTVATPLADAPVSKATAWEAAPRQFQNARPTRNWRPCHIC